MFGLDLTVGSTVRYRVRDDRGVALLDKQIPANGGASIGDAVIAIERLRIANERAIQNNLKALLDELGLVSSR